MMSHKAQLSLTYILFTVFMAIGTEGGSVCYYLLHYVIGHSTDMGLLVTEGFCNAHGKYSFFKNNI